MPRSDAKVQDKSIVKGAREHTQKYSIFGRSLTLVVRGGLHAR